VVIVIHALPFVVNTPSGPVPRHHCPTQETAARAARSALGGVCWVQDAPAFVDNQIPSEFNISHDAPGTVPSDGLLPTATHRAPEQLTLCKAPGQQVEKPADTPAHELVNPDELIATWGPAVQNT
jgi:hypothetical protein